VRSDDAVGAAWTWAAHTGSVGGPSQANERARSLAETLGGAGFTDVVCAAAGADLVETVQRLAPDLVVIDMTLPDRDALESVRSLSASAPRPIVMFADEDDPEFVEDAIAGRRMLL
jgi:two-component system, response regulator / RNA-binding antiterminator